jgi:hypothetical protein
MFSPFEKKPTTTHANYLLLALHHPSERSLLSAYAHNHVLNILTFTRSNKTLVQKSRGIRCAAHGFARREIGG